MKFPHLRFTVPVLCLLAALAAPLAARGEKVEFPKDEPAFTVTIPESWTSSIDKDGTLNAKPQDSPDLVLLIVAVPEIDDDKAARATVPQLLQAIAKKSDLSDVKLGEITEGKTPKGIPCIHAEARGKKKNGAEIALTSIIFAADEGDYYALVTIATPDAEKSHEKELVSILESIDNE